jgi:GT2 family glycosyltransferase/SAM-dependent methyltransferase
MKTLASFQDIHQGKTIVVCGCGESLNDLAQPERFITIGVNDVGRRFQPNYLVVVNPRNQFSGDRFQFVESSQAEYLFTQLDLGVRHPNVVKFRLGAFGGTDFTDKNVLHYTNNSPYIALNLAILMGAKRIGLIGVDFTDNHFFAATGRHALAPQFDSINQQYCRLADAAKSYGVEIFNLSQISRLTAFSKISAEEFENFQQPEPEITEKSNSLKIVSYATTPVAGVPAILARCINARTNHSARCVWAMNSYGNGVEFAGDVEWKHQPQTAENLLSEADLIIAHNGKIAPEHERFFNGKAVVTMAHNYLWNVDERFVRHGFAGVVVGQYQAALDEFAHWSIVPNPIPFWENEYQPSPKNPELAICYTPSGKHEKYPLNHKLYWHSKGYETTMRILEKLSKRFSLKLEVIRSGQISHAESLAMKRRSHIVIDECVTGSYHRNSLEGLAGAAVVVNGLGILPKVENVLRSCAGEQAEIPFVSATLENLEEVLTRLIESGRENLVQKGAENRLWLEKYWNFSRQWEKFWIPAIEKSFAKINRKFNFKGAENKKSNDILLKETLVNQQMKEFKKGVSVVIPHGGENRLPHLQACLANLRQCAEVGEIIIAEMDTEPNAVKIARKWADKYVFIRRTNLFEKARVLNTGSALAECEFVLWLDNDLLVALDFIQCAAAEINSRELDFLIPYSEIQYLSPEDSVKVMTGGLFPDQCRPINKYTNTMTDGGAVIVRTEFLRRCGGVPEVFRGWGGEDNGWRLKVGLLGKSGRTSSKQIVFHLYHELSGGNGGDAHRLANPHYEQNLEMVTKMRRISNPAEFLREFPPDKIRVCDNSREIYLVAEKDGKSFSAASRLKTQLSERFGIETEIISAGKLRDDSGKQNHAGALVFFDDPVILQSFSAKLSATLSGKIIVIAGKNSFDKERRGVFAVLTAGDDFQKAENSNGSIWKYDEKNLPVTLAQVLSLLVNNQKNNVPIIAERVSEKNLSRLRAISKFNARNTMSMTIAKKDDLLLPEFAAFNDGGNYPPMRRWELPFALYQMRLSGFMSVLDCTINPVNFGQRLAGLYPNAVYRHFQPVSGKQFILPNGMPDGEFDRVVCINTLEHLLKSQREELLAALARKLKPGGLMVITCDQYPETFWEKPELVKMGLVSASGEEVFNGFNQVSGEELIETLKKYGLNPVSKNLAKTGDAELYRNVEPYPHTCLGMVFCKSAKPVLPKGKKIMLSLLSWNTKNLVLDSLEAHLGEAAMLRRLGCEPFVVVCDNGSADGTREALQKLDKEINLPHKFILNESNKGSSVARNQIIDLMLARREDYLLMLDGDIEIVPHSSYAIMRYMEDQGHFLGCLGPYFFGYSDDRNKTTKVLFDLAKCSKENVDSVALTQYGMYRRAVFEDGIRFDESEPFNGEGWGFEDNDLAFQMLEKNYQIQLFKGITYLHRDVHSSIRVMKSNGREPYANFEARRNYMLKKWNNAGFIAPDVIRALQVSGCPQV